MKEETLLNYFLNKISVEELAEDFENMKKWKLLLENSVDTFDIKDLKI